MKCIRCVFNSKRLRIVPRRYFFLASTLLLITLVSFLHSLLWQYESKENTRYVAGKITNIQCFDTFNVKGSRFLLLLEVNKEEYYIWFPPSGNQVYEQSVGCDVNVRDHYAELLVSKQFGKNRVVDFRCDGQTLFSIATENCRIRQEKLTAFFTAILSLALCLIIQLVILISYKVIKISKIKK